MKKATIILVLLSVMLFSVIAVANAADSKEEYYEEISCAISNVEFNLLHDNLPEAEVQMKTLRETVYLAARFLAANKEYDVRIMQVIGLAEKAFANADKYEVVIEYMALSRNTASLVLLGRIENDIEDACNRHAEPAAAGSSEGESDHS